MIKHITILCFAVLCLSAYGQDQIKVSFYPDSLTVNGKNIELDTIRTLIPYNEITRFIIWENGDNKVSVVFKTKRTNTTCIVKSKVEIYKHGNWRSSGIRLRVGSGIRLNLSKWTHRSKGMCKTVQAGASKSGYPIHKSYVGSNKHKICISGYLEILE